MSQILASVFLLAAAIILPLSSLRIGSFLLAFVLSIFILPLSYGIGKALKKYLLKKPKLKVFLKSWWIQCFVVALILIETIGASNASTPHSEKLNTMGDILAVVYFAQLLVSNIGIVIAYNTMLSDDIPS